MEMLQAFQEKISYAVEKVKALKEEKDNLERRISELEEVFRLKDQEIERIASENSSIRSQLESLLNELELIELK
ncbi:hypothetical protein M1N10_04325 [Thermodesulfovibrionales bacterium]|nr:hypothetical protein [Thermodesulfovibrionales bacterium]